MPIGTVDPVSPAPSMTSQPVMTSQMPSQTMTSQSMTSHHQRTLEAAVDSGDALELSRILESFSRSGKFNVNRYDQEGQTALHRGCMEGNLEVVKLLVKFGADVKLANRDGWSALHIAAYGGHRDITLYLIDAFKR